MKEKILKLILDSVDFDKLSIGLIDNILDEALQKVVDNSKNPFDNAAKAYLYPLLSEEVKKLISKEIEELKEKVLAK